MMEPIRKPSINDLYYLPQVDSTNSWAKQHLDAFGPIGAVYTTDQTAGRGRLGRQWQGAPGQMLCITVVVKSPLAQPATLSLFSSLATANLLRDYYGLDCRIKWPNDLLIGGKKVVGILCEGIPEVHAWLCGIGINLAQPQRYFDDLDLPHATSLALAGARVDPEADPERLAGTLTDFGFDRALYHYETDGFAVCREEYKARCINLGRHVTYDGGAGQAVDIDEEGNLVVQEDGSGLRRVFTGEVSVQGIYGAL